MSIGKAPQCPLWRGARRLQSLTQATRSRLVRAVRTHDDLVPSQTRLAMPFGSASRLATILDSVGQFAWITGAVALLAACGVVPKAARPVPPSSAPEPHVLEDGPRAAPVVMCDQKSRRGCAELGADYVPADNAHAKIRLQQACDGGDGDACCKLGAEYEVGHPSPNDSLHAFDLYQQGRAASHTEACPENNTEVSVSSMEGPYLALYATVWVS
jgi:hypothetical protein